MPVEESYDEETDEYTEFTKRDVTPKDTSRIAAKHAKEAINALVRKSAREQIFEEFSERIGDIITGTVLQSTPDFTIVKIREGVEAELPHFDQRRYPEERNERPAGERYLHNQRLQRRHRRRPRPQLHRARHEGRALAPADRHLAHAPGAHPAASSSSRCPRSTRARSRSSPSPASLAVARRSPCARSTIVSTPVGACVGPKGSRVRAVVSELRGERVDVILWDADPARYVANALSPAKVSRVLIDSEKGYAGVIVPDDQLSLAIGKDGQNARLAARLTGWHIDIKNEKLAAEILGNLHVREEADDDLVGEDEDGRCAFVSEDGVRCRNQARPGSRFCGVHDSEAEDGEDATGEDWF